MTSSAQLPKGLRSPEAWLAVIFAIAAYFAYAHRFIQDDAFISFRYAKHFAEGEGLVWQPGSTEYGYTNFLFTVAVGLLMKLGFAAKIAAFSISVPAYFGALLYSFLISKQLTNKIWVSYLTVGALAFNLSFSAYATGGLETSLQTFLLLGSYGSLLCWWHNKSKRYLIFFGAYAALALLTRLDSSILLLPAYIFLFLVLFDESKKKSVSGIQVIDALLITISPPLVALSSLLFFCYMYYGYPLPNTFYIKIDSEWHWLNGFKFLTNYIKAEAYVPLLIIGWAAFSFKSAPIDRRLCSLLLMPLILWIFYILRIGGDFMEFRILVPLLPFFYLLCFYLITAGEPNSKADALRIGLLSLLVVVGFSVHRYAFYEKLKVINSSNAVGFNNMNSLGALNGAINESPNNWLGVGKTLHALFYTGSPDDVEIATTAAGAIPYFSNLPTVDELGLNTRDIMNYNVPFLNIPGHRMRVSLDYLYKQKVNLVIDHPIYYRQVQNCLAVPNFIFHRVIPSAPMLFIPINSGHFLIAYYLTPHPRVEQLLQEGKIYRCTGWKEPSDIEH